MTTSNVSHLLLSYSLVVCVHGQLAVGSTGALRMMRCAVCSDREGWKSSLEVLDGWLLEESLSLDRIATSSSVRYLSELCME